MAEFTVAAVGGREPVLQAGPVHHGQATAALAGGQQLPRGRALVADPAKRLLPARTKRKGPLSTSVTSSDASMSVIPHTRTQGLQFVSLILGPLIVKDNTITLKY